MPRLQKFQPLLLALIFMCAAGGALAWLWFEVERLGTELTDRIQTIKNEQAFDTQFNELTLMVEQTQDERAQLQQYILGGEDDTIELLSELDAIAAQQGVTLGTNELSVAPATGAYDDLRVSFQITGAEQRVMHMIELFETLPYHGDITSLSLTRQTDETGARSVTASIALTLTIKDHDQ